MKQVKGFKNDFKFCPMCGSRNIENHADRKWLCPDCGFDLYNNVATAVGIIIYDKNDKVLFEVRAKEPRKGFLAVPGGFVDFNESAEEAVLRECREEIGVEVSGATFLCSAPNIYAYKGIEYKTCDLFFSAPLPDKYDSIEDYIKSLKAEESEVLGFEAHLLADEKDLDALPLAFGSARTALLAHIKNQKK